MAAWTPYKFKSLCSCIGCNVIIHKFSLRKCPPLHTRLKVRTCSDHGPKENDDDD